MAVLTNVEMTYLFATASLVTFIWIYYRYFNYWNANGIESIPLTFLLKNFLKMAFRKSSIVDFFTTCYKHSEKSLVGMYVFHKPILMIRSPEMVKQIIVKDFQYFPNRFMATDCKNDPLGTNNLIFIKSPNWYELKKQVAPAFSSLKMKSMFESMKHVGEELLQYITMKSSECDEFDIREIVSRYTTDSIASFAFGMKSHSFQEYDYDLRKFGRKIFEVDFYRLLEMTCFFFLPQVASLFNCKFIQNDMSEFMRKTTWDAIDKREHSGEFQNDFIDLLIKLKNTPYSGKGLKMEEDTIVAQTTIFFIAGFETSTATISFALYELALNTSIQDRIRSEIRTVLEENNGELTYEGVMNMSYLDMAVSETLRKYPAQSFLDRECKKEDGYRLPVPYERTVLKPGTPVIIPLTAIHMDSNFFPSPEVFDPERFTRESKQYRHPYCYMPFGAGPRGCTGERLGLIQVKIGLIYFLKNHCISPCSETPIPMVFDPLAPLMTPKGQLRFKIERVYDL